ncbi:MAG TPA: autotransporter-associated beta strand repeat-containing protein, partial [Bradyrhizobium sp.]|uniref:FecR domain-containing protein n=1 Tax=Bradyrhizobium sp. TaxID=376 RepID=UPI002C529082
MNYAGKFDAKHDADGSGLHSHGHAHVETVTAHATHVPADAIIVPDAQLLFNADFKRSGVDLVLSRDDHELVLHDYFKGEKRAALSSPDGAHLTGELVNALTGHTEYAQAGGAAGANAVIGHVTKLAGSATAIRNGVSIILNQGDNVEKGDVVQSGSDSTVGITFIDGTVFGLSSNARMVLNEMVYDPNGSNNSSLISLVAGTISFVAGQTAKHGDMKIDTPVATMGIRGTAVLCEIDFNVSTPGVPDAKFQVLVEPDGTTGSYILFDKNTLTPIAEVNKAGQLIHIREGLVSISNAGLSDEMQKLINEVFAEKYAYDTTPKTFDHQFTDSIVPLPLTPIILTNGQTITGTAYILNTSDKTGPSGSSGPINSLSHIDGPPHAVIVNLLGQPISGFQITELAGKTGDSADLDSVSGAVNFVDINAGDAPSVSAKFGSFSYQNAAHQDVTAALNAQQLADIAAVEAKLVLTPNAGNNNVGTTAFSYSVPDSALDFLAAGETLTLTYNIKVDNNYGPNDESTPLTLTITITGTNDVPVITTSAPSIAFSGGTSVPGGDLPTSDPTSGTLAFTDVDLTDTHTVATALTGAVGVLNGITVLNGVDALPPGPLDLLKTALTASIAAGNDSTLTGNGTINWNLAELPVYIADFLPKGETLTLTYTVTLTDSQGATTTQDVIVTITGTDTPAVVWIATATPGSQPGGLWSDGSNWETGTVPTANDDAIIITNQLIGLTPSYPVTIDAPAFAKTVTLNDFSDLGNAHPELNNDSTLTIGGAFTLGVDSIVDNSGTIGVGGAMEVLDASILNNSGTIDLAQGGDFKDQTSITNAGKIDVTGGTLNILVDVANAGGNLVIEGTARGTLSGAAITGGAVNNSGEFDLSGGLLTSGSLDNAGTIDVSSIGNELLGETVTANYALEVLAGGSLSIDQGSTVANGGGTVTVDGTGTLTLNGASLAGGTVTNKSGGAIDLAGSGVLNTGSLDNAGKIDVSGSGNALNSETVTANNALEILAGGALSIDQGSTVANGGGTVTVDGTGTLTLNGASIAGGTVTNKSGGAIDLTGSGVLNTGSLDNAGKIDVSGSGNALNAETVTANNALEILAGGALSIDPTTIDNSGGTVTVDGTGTLTLNGATITGGTVNDSGEIDLTGSAAVKTGTLNSSGTIKVSGSGNALDGENVTNGGGIEVVGALTLDQSTTVANGGGTITIDSTGTLTLNNASISNGTLGNSGLVDATGTNGLHGIAITNASGATLESTGGVLTIDGSNTTFNNVGLLEANGGGLDLNNDTLTNTGTLKATDSSVLELTSTTVTNTNGTVTVDALSTLDLNGGDSISNGTLGNSGLLDATGTNGLHDIAITNASGATLESTGGVLTIDGSNTTFNNAGLLEANGGGLDLNTDTLTNTGTLKATNSSTLELTNTGVTNTGGTVTVDAGSTLNLNGGDSITNGTLSNSGTLNSIGTNSIGAAVGGGGTLNVVGGTLTLTGDNTYTGATTINGGTLKLSGTGSISASSDVVDDATFDISATTAGASIVTLSGTG